MATPIQRSRAVRPSEKAAYHQITGAGKAHIKREFFGLSAADEAFIEQEVDHQVTVRLQVDGTTRGA